MKDALVAQKRFLFGGVILAIGALFYAQKSIGRELIANGLARLATAEELQANGGLDEAIDEAGEAETEQAEQPEPETNQPADEAGEAETEQEEVHADASGDAPASEEPPAPVPARRGRKSAS